jgi:hypothetical protein
VSKKPGAEQKDSHRHTTGGKNGRKLLNILVEAPGIEPGLNAYLKNRSRARKIWARKQLAKNGKSSMSNPGLTFCPKIGDFCPKLNCPALAKIYGEKYGKSYL